MKTYNHLYEQIISEPVRRAAVMKVLHDRKDWRSTKRFAKDPEKTVQDSLKWIENYKNGQHNPIKIFDGTRKKERIIYVPSFKELVVQHCIVEVLKPVMFKGMYRHSYASIPARLIHTGKYNEEGKPIYIKEKRGSHQAKKYIEKWIKEDPENTKYVLKMDIRKFFDSIPQDKLIEWYKKFIHDDKMIDLLIKVTHAIPQGIPLGYHTSQWFSNWYLQDVDHYIKEVCGVKYFTRYMDDMAIHGKDKEDLHRIRKQVQLYLKVHKGLELKNNYQIFRFDYIDVEGKRKGHDLDYMGFRFFHDKTILRKSILHHVATKSRRIKKKGKLTIHDARQMTAYNGYLVCTGTHQYYLFYIAPNVTISKCNAKISRYDRRKAA